MFARICIKAVQDEQYIKDTSLDFCKKQKLKEALFRSVDLIQNSAISFSVCVDNKYKNLDALVAKLRADFKVTVHENVSLYTLRHATEEALKSLEKDKKILLKQVMQNTVQLLTV